ncbi:MAG: helix-turn-helix domain-containing protein [Acidimicrobiales bacterium]
MSAPVRYDEQYCPIARALDALGDRWTLLVLRELAGGDRRFTDLKRALVGITPAVLTGRLRQLIDEGMVCEVPGGSTRVTYAITERGREAQPVLRALARFGMDLLEDPAEAERIRPWSAVQTCLVVWFDPLAATELAVDERYLVRVDGDETLLSSVRGGGPTKAPIVTLDVDAATLFAIRQGRRTWADAVADGSLVTTGPKAAVTRFRRLFRLV